MFKLPCCGHYAHTECFKTWASLSRKESTVRCAYCRTIYPYEDTCFLCLQEYTEKLICTACCHTKVHTECSTAVLTEEQEAAWRSRVTLKVLTGKALIQSLPKNKSLQCEIEQFIRTVLFKTFTLNRYINCSLFISNNSIH